MLVGFHAVSPAFGSFDTKRSVFPFVGTHGGESRGSVAGTSFTV